MYCNKCGEKLPEGSGFCPKCGNEVRPAASVQTKPKVNPNASFYAKAFGVANVILALLSFTPWIAINANVVSPKLTRHDVFTNASSISSTLQSYLGSSADQASSVLSLIAGCGFVMLFAMVITNAVDAVRFFSKGNGTVSGFATSLLCSALMIVGVLCVNAYISMQSSSYYSDALSGILSVTTWPWLIAVSCIVLACLKLKFDKSIDSTL